MNHTMNKSILTILLFLTGLVSYAQNSFSVTMKLTDEKTNLQTQLTEKDGTIAKYETDSVKTKVAREYGLSYEAISFLQGETEDAIRESAKTLKGIVGSGSAPQFNPEGSKNVDSTEKAFIEMLGNLGGN